MPPTTDWVAQGHWLLALPAQHVAGVQVLVRSLIAGTRPTVLDRPGRFTPDSFVAAAGRVGGRPGHRRYTALGPDAADPFARRSGESPRRAIERSAGFDAVLVGGAATAPALLERAAAAGVALVTTYGMSETCGGCVYDGTPLDGVSAQIEDDGRVLLAGPMRRSRLSG